MWSISGLLKVDVSKEKSKGGLILLRVASSPGALVRVKLPQWESVSVYSRATDLCTGAHGEKEKGRSSHDYRRMEVKRHDNPPTLSSGGE